VSYGREPDDTNSISYGRPMTCPSGRYARCASATRRHSPVPAPR